MKKKANEMIKNKIIEEKTTPYVSSLLVIPKKNNDIRMCVDFRRLNSQMFLDHRIATKNWRRVKKIWRNKIQFSSFDLTSGYWQIPLHEDSQKYTGFMCNGRTFVFKVMAFGDATAVGSFTRAMQSILGPEILEFVTVYLDDSF